MRFKLRDARLAFPDVHTPRIDAKTGRKSFGAKLIIPPDHVQTVDAKTRAELTKAGIKLPPDPKAKIKTVPLFRQIEKVLARAKWNDKADAILKALGTQDKLFLHDGATKSEYEGFEGNLFVSANNKIKPSLWDQMKNEVDEASGVIYSGCFVIASLDFWAQDHKEHGKRLNAGLRGLQKLRDGDAFAGGGSAADSDEFDEIGVDGEEAEGGEEVSDEAVDLTA